MPTIYDYWIVLGVPPDEYELVVCGVLTSEEIETEEKAIRSVKDREKEYDRDDWKFRAVLLKKDENNSSKNKFKEALLSFGVPEKELEDTIIELTQQIRHAIVVINATLN